MTNENIINDGVAIDQLLKFLIDIGYISVYTVGEYSLEYIGKKFNLEPFVPEANKILNELLTYFKLKLDESIIDKNVKIDNNVIKELLIYLNNNIEDMSIRLGITDEFIISKIQKFLILPQESIKVE